MKKKAVFPLNINTYAIQKILEDDTNYEFSGYLANTEPPDELKMLGRELNIDSYKIIDPKNFIEKEIDSILIADDQGFDLRVVSNLIKELEILNKEIIIAPHISKKHPKYSNKQFEDESTGISDTLLDTIPVVSIMGIGENLLKLETQKHINDIFAGYKILNISSKGTMIDNYFISFPENLFSNRLSISVKINLMRRYIHDFLQRNDFDLIVITIPGSLTQSDVYHNELALVISNAFSIDINIVNLYTNFDISKNTIEMIDKTCKYKFNSDLNIFNVVPICIRYSEEMLGNRYDYYAVDEKSQHEIMNNCLEGIEYIEQKIFTLNRKILSEIPRDFYIEKLTNNIEII